MNDIQSITNKNMEKEMAIREIAGEWLNNNLI